MESNHTDEPTTTHTRYPSLRAAMNTATAGAAVATGSRTLSRARNPYWNTARKERLKQKQYYRDIARSRGAVDFRGNPIFTPYTWNIRPGDLVQVTQPSVVKDYGAAGKPKTNQFGQTMTHKWFGQQGKVLAVLRRQERIIVEGVNFKTRAMRVRHKQTTSARAGVGGVRGTEPVVDPSLTFLFFLAPSLLAK